MSENTETETVETPRIHSTFGELLSGIEPETVRLMLIAKLDDALNLTRAHNKSIAQIQESSKNDPEDTTYQDKVWERVVGEMESGERESDNEFLAAEKRYQKAVAAMEKELAKLREASKNYMEEALTDEEITKKKQEVNQNKPNVQESRNSAKVMAEMADQLLGREPGTVFGHMPAMDSLLNVGRGRKTGATTKSSGSHISRIGETKMNGVDAGHDGKYSFAYLAKKLSDQFNAKAFPANGVTAIELEEAMYKAAGVELRKREDLPEIVKFDFTKNILVQNPNDDTTKEEPQVISFEIHKYYRPA